jgi:DhnA family fructose-bisphosphate aldolase class Ia
MFTVAETYGQILLVGEDKKKSVPQLVLVQHTLELLTCLNNTVAIVAVDDEDDTLGVLEVMPP